MKKGQCGKNLKNTRAGDWRAGIARTVWPVLLGALVLGEASAAEVFVFDQSPANGNDAFASISAEQSADGFTLSAATSVTGLTWWGSYSQDPTTLPADAFRVRIFADDGSGAPAANPRETIPTVQQLTRSPTALLDRTGAPVYRFDLVVGPVTLAGATNWYLSVVNEFDVADPDASWYWLLSDTTGQNFYRFVDGDAWSSDLNPPTGNLAFQVSGNPVAAIPIPGSLILVLSGLAGLRLMASRGCGKLAASGVEG